MICFGCYVVCFDNGFGKISGCFVFIVNKLSNKYWKLYVMYEF